MVSVVVVVVVFGVEDDGNDGYVEFCQICNTFTTYNPETQIYPECTKTDMTIPALKLCIKVGRIIISPCSV